LKDKNGCEDLLYIGKKYNFNGVIRIKNKEYIPSDGKTIDDWYHPLNIKDNCDWRDSEKFKLTEREIKILEKQKNGYN